MGCQSTEERVGVHVSRAETLLGKGRPQEALLELRAAVQLRPDDAALNLRLADLLIDYGRPSEAIHFYREASYLEPENSETALRLAELLVRDDPKQARQLIDGVLSREPKSSGARLRQADLALASGDTREAMRLVELARILAPEDPEVYWQLARVNETKIRSIRSRPGRRLHDSATFKAVLDAYDQYYAKGGTRQIEALVARAQLLAIWPGHDKQASRGFHIALRTAEGEGTLGEVLFAASRARDYARTADDRVLLERSLRLLLERAPWDMDAWLELARSYPESSPARDDVYASLLERQADNPHAHVLYAQHVLERDGLPAAIESIRKQVEAGQDEAVLLAGMVELQLVAGRPLDAAKTVRILLEKYPDHPSTRLATARQQLRDREVTAALTNLHELIETNETAEAQLLLARAESLNGNHAAALAAVDRSLDLTSGFGLENRRLKARILYDSGDYEGLIQCLAEIDRVFDLTPPEILMLATARYETRAIPLGRKLLIDLLESPFATTEAALEFSRREARNVLHQERIERYLQAAHEREPANIEVLSELVAFELRNGRPQQAILRLHEAIGRLPGAAELYLLRARTLLALGKLPESRDDAERALAIDPSHGNDAVELLAFIYGQVSDPLEIITRMQQGLQKGELPPHRMVLLARLYLQQGDEARALATYEAALAAGSEFTLLKNDLAYLLARQGRDLERAARLAKEAQAAPGEQLAAADTLGYVYLRSGQNEAALWQFRYVVERADPPVAGFHYHMGLALRALGREAEARESFSRALAIDPGFPDAADARRALGVAASDPAVAADPS